MERRDFLKGIFGAAVVAAMPIAVINRIEQSEVQYISDRVHKADELGTMIKPIDEVLFANADNILFVYDEEKLIGFSNLFDLDFQRPPLIDISTMSDKIWEGARKKPTKKHKKGKKIYVYNDNNCQKFMQAPKSWSLNATMVNWEVDPMIYMENDKMLNCLIKQGNMKIVGNMLITSHTLSIPIDDQISGSATFEGSGELTVILEKG